jgi:uncharacterized protein
MAPDTGDTGDTGGEPAPAPGGSTGDAADPAGLQAALEDYQTALTQREAAYAENDLVAAAEADAAMQDAVERAIAALG